MWVNAPKQILPEATNTADSKVIVQTVWAPDGKLSNPEISHFGHIPSIS